MTSSTICSHHRIRTVLLMCVVLLSASLHAQAQNKETRINLNIRNATLESFVKQLENATGFSFIYGEEVKLTHRITLEMKQKNISEILQRAFENEPITFEISGKHILLHKRPVPQKPVSRKFTISGYVTDGASSETLIGANILESRRSTGTATNPFGFYSLTLPEGETELVFFFGTSTNWEEKVEMGEGRSFGLELMAQKTLGKTTGWLAYTLSKTDHRFKSGTINQGRWFPYKYDRRHSISLNLSHKFSDRIDAGASWIFNTGGCITIPEKATIIVSPDGVIEETGYISGRNNYRLPASHRLNLGVNFNKKTKHGIRTWNISIYNAYNAMNPNIVYSKYKKSSYLYQPDGNGGFIEHKEEGKISIKKLTILPCIPSVTYTYRF